MIPLEAFGPRICILGRSNGGKSTLAEAIGRKLGCPAVHLDLLYHRPHTDWVPRPQSEFLTLHGEAIAGESWVMEGNYSLAMPERLARATGLILIDTPTLPNLWRYVRRTLFERGGPGRLEGNQDSFKWAMVRQIVVINPRRTRKQADMLKSFGGAARHLKSMREINALYREWGLERRLPRRG